MGIFMNTGYAASLYRNAEITSVYYGTEKVWPDPTDSDSATDWLYRSDDTGITLLLYMGSEAVLHIPSQIDGIPVTALAPTACNYAPLRSVTIPASITALL